MDQLLAVKLQPLRPVRDLTPPPRLLERLQRAVYAPLTLVSAPAGFGKSTLLAEWQLTTVLALMDALLRYLPAPLHLILATRSDPPLPLARLRARGQLVEIRRADLVFSHIKSLNV